MSECVGMLSCKRNQLPFSQNCSPTLEVWFHNLASTWPWNSLFTIFPSHMNSLWITLKKVISVVLTLRCASSGPWWWFCSPLYTLIGLDGVLMRCNSVSLLLIHDICVEQTAHIFLFCKPSWRIWWNCFPLNMQWILDQFLWSFGGLWLPVYELQLFTDSGPLTAGHFLDHLRGFKVLYILSKYCKPFRVICVRQSICVYNFEHYVC